MRKERISVTWEGLFFLAPLAGYTDMPFRKTMKKFGADVLITEMVSAMGLTSHGKRTRKYTDYDTDEHPIGIQLFGSKPETMACAAAIGEQMGFDFVDVNMGCPVKKVTKTGAGAHLMKDPPLAARIIREIRKRVKIPVTAKIRVGWTPEDETYLELVRALAGEGIEALTVHGRPVSSGMEGPVFPLKIARIKELFPDLFIIANGGIESFEDLGKLISVTGCRAAMIGRGALKDPIIFLKLKGEYRPGLPTKGDFVRAHFDLHTSFYGERAAVLFRKYLSWYSRGLPGSAEFRRRVNTIRGSEELRIEIERFFSNRREYR